MCLTIPGRVTGIEEADPSRRFAQVDFRGVLKRVSLIYLPEARVGDHVLVHAGFATEVVPEAEAAEALRTMAEAEARERGGLPGEPARGSQGGP